MPINKVGFNASGVKDISPPDFNISGDPTTFVNEIPIKANEYTQGFGGTAVMVTLVVYLYYKLADKSQVSSFRYSHIRSLSVACGIVGIIGMVMFSIGYFTQLYPVIFFIIMFMITFILVVKEER